VLNCGYIKSKRGQWAARKKHLHLENVRWKIQSWNTKAIVTRNLLYQPIVAVVPLDIEMYEDDRPRAYCSCRDETDLTSLWGEVAAKTGGFVGLLLSFIDVFAGKRVLPRTA
jgi:hypothetical protein